MAATSCTPTTKKCKEPHSLNYRQRRFAAEYLKDHNATQAAIRAGYSAHTSHVIGTRLLKNVAIKSIVEAGHQTALDRAGVSAERVIREFAEVGFKSSKQMDVKAGDKLAALDKLARMLTLYADAAPQGGTTNNILVADAAAARDLLARIIGQRPNKIVDVETE